MRQLVLHNASMPSYVAPGYLMFAREGKLMVQPFDATLLRTAGDPVPVVPERVAFDDFSGVAVYSVSQDGVLLYLPDTPIASQLQWWAGSGKAPENIAEPGFNRMLQMSPKGGRVLVDRSSGIWIYEIPQHIWNRFTFRGGGLSEARWSPDGRQVFYTDRQGRVFNLCRKASDDSGAEETLWQSDQWLAPRSVSPNGRYLLYETYDAQQGFQLSQLTLSGNRQTTAFIQTQFNEGNATFSPDGHWVTYVSDKSGEFQIYARPFPGPGEEWQISSGTASEVGGGSSIALKWRADGKEAFYLSADWQVMSVSVTTTPRFQTGVPRPLFRVLPGSQFDVTADGQRFLVNAPLQNSESQPLNVVLNWNSAHPSK
jgi:Tol biopolymer transport system component